MTMAAEGHRHIKTIWRGDKPWHWVALAYGHANMQPGPPLRRWGGPRRWTFHLTPIHVERDMDKWELGLCVGRRTIYLRKHA